MSDIESRPPAPSFEHAWSSERKVRFLDRLAAKGNVRAACAFVGMSRESAYRLRRRDPLFARGWAAALVLARDLGAEVLADRAVEGVEEEIYYRGELIGTRRRYDSRLLLAHLARLDSQVNEAGAAPDAARFDELLACIGGEHAPEELIQDDDVLPLDSNGSAARAEKSVVRGQEHSRDDIDYAQWCTREEGRERWESWFAEACGYVDRASGQNGGCADLHARENSLPRTVSDVSTIALATAMSTPSANLATSAPSGR